MKQVDFFRGETVIKFDRSCRGVVISGTTQIMVQTGLAY